MTAAPGLIDIHVHGGYGIAFGYGNLSEDLKKYSEWVTRFGVTGFVISITGPDPDFILHAIRTYIPLFEEGFIGAQPLGLHLEGPFINPQKHGAFNPAWIRQPSLKEMGAYLDAGNGWIRHVSLAPELEGADKVATGSSTTVGEVKINPASMKPVWARCRDQLVIESTDQSVIKSRNDESDAEYVIQWLN